MVTEAFFWICKGDKNNTYKRINILKNKIKEKFSYWSGMIYCEGTNERFVIIIEDGTLKEKDKEKVRNYFTDLISELHLDLLI